MWGAEGVEGQEFLCPQPGALVPFGDGASHPTARREEGERPSAPGLGFNGAGGEGGCMVVVVGQMLELPSSLPSDLGLVPLLN